MNLPGWLAVVTAAEVVAIGGMGGIGVRMIIRSVRDMRERVQQLSTYVAVDKVTGPAQVARLDRAESAIGINTARIAVLEDWRNGHEQRHTDRGQ